MNYMERLIKAFSNWKEAGLCEPHIKHDDWCELLKGNGSECTCVPEITFETENGIVEIDIDGNMKRI